MEQKRGLGQSAQAPDILNDNVAVLKRATQGNQLTTLMLAG
ncbi:hypothetical protein [Levilactobacillus namurensis]|nr:hypothetical protein [Levilactobacillus namurensis]